MDNQSIFKKDWIMRALDKSLENGLQVSPEMIVSEFNIPSADAILILNDWFASRLASLIEGASK